MISTPATIRLIARDRGEPRRDHSEDRVERRYERVLGDDRDVLGARMPRLDQRDDVALRGLHRVAARRLDEHPKHGRGVEDLLRIRDGQDHSLVDLEAAREAELREHADHATARVADSQPLADRVLLIVELVRDRVPSTHTGLAMSSSLGGRNRPRPIVQCWIDAIGSLVPTTVMSRTRARVDTVPAPTTTGVTWRTRASRLTAIVSCERELACRLADQETLDAAATRGVGLARQHDQEIRAEGLELAGDVASRSFANGGQHHDAATPIAIASSSIDVRSG
jgi:hypothetical protein